MEFEEIYKRLHDLAIPYEQLHHEPVFTCAEADRLTGQEETGKTKNLFLRNKKGNRHYLAVLSSEDQLDLGFLAENLGEEKLSFASEDRLARFLRQKPGCVSPLGLVYDPENLITVLIQRKVLKSEKLSFHPNLNTVSLILTSSDLTRYLDSVAPGWKILERL